MRALRTHYADEAEFVRRVDEVQRPEGYRLVGAFEGERCLAAAGFRELHTLAWGHVIYVDDLSTHPDGRRRGLRARPARVVRRGGARGWAATSCIWIPAWRPTASMPTGSISTPGCASRASTSRSPSVRRRQRRRLPPNPSDRGRRANRPPGRARAGGARGRVDSFRGRGGRRGGGGAVRGLPAARSACGAGRVLHRGPRAGSARPARGLRDAPGAAARSPRHGGVAFRPPRRWPATATALPGRGRST